MSLSFRPSRLLPTGRPLLIGFAGLLAVAFGVGWLVDGLARAGAPATQPQPVTIKCVYTVESVTLTNGGTDSCGWASGMKFCSDCKHDLARDDCTSTPGSIRITETCVLNFVQGVPGGNAGCSLCPSDAGNSGTSDTRFRRGGERVPAAPDVHFVLQMGASAPDPLRKPKDSIEWAESVRTLLDLPEGNGNLVPVLRAITDQVDRQAKAGVDRRNAVISDGLLADVADVVLNGVDAKKWTRHFLAEVSILKTDVRPADGDLEVYDLIWRQMYARAVDLEKTDPEQAKRLSRGMLMFAALTSPVGPPSAVAYSATGNRVNRLASVAALDDYQVREFNALALWVNQQMLAEATDLTRPLNQRVWDAQDARENGVEAARLTDAEERVLLADIESVWGKTPATSTAVYHVARSSQNLVTSLTLSKQYSAAQKVAQLVQKQAERYEADPALARIIRQVVVPEKVEK